MSRRTRWVALAVCVVGVATAVVTASPGRAAPEVHLTAAGDYAATSDTAAVLDAIAGLEPDAHLALGDLGYNSVPDPYAWCDFVKQRVGEGFPFQLVSGNHESDDNNDGDINDFSSCLPNQVPGITGTYGRQYAMDLPANAPLVRVIQASPNLTFEDGRLTYTAGDANYSWLSNAIDEGRANGARWIIVTSHYPCLTVGTNSCPSSSRDFYDLLVDKNVDLVLHGHEHNYARTHQLAGGGPDCSLITVGSTNVACIADGDDAFGAGFGTVFATVGTGGIQLRDVNPADSEAGYFAAWSGANSTPTHGLLDLSITEEQLVAAFVDATGGGFADSFTITQGLPSPTTTTTAPTTSTTPPTTTATTTTTTTTTTGTTDHHRPHPDDHDHHNKTTDHHRPHPDDHDDNRHDIDVHDGSGHDDHDHDDHHDRATGCATVRGGHFLAFSEHRMGRGRQRRAVGFVVRDGVLGRRRCRPPGRAVRKRPPGLPRRGVVDRHRPQAHHVGRQDGDGQRSVRLDHPESSGYRQLSRRRAVRIEWPRERSARSRTLDHRTRGHRPRRDCHTRK